MRIALILVAFLCFCGNLLAQRDSTSIKELDFTGDLRFRVEHDWNSINSNGVKRDDRSRLRYRFRFGATYTLDSSSSFGARIRSGNINDQQGPHVTLGGQNNEFGLVQLGFEKLYYQFKRKKISAWFGKNSIGLKKLNELFWNDNVYPEGIGFKYNFVKQPQKALSSATLNAGHFVINAQNQTFNKDSYLQTLQFEFNFIDDRISFFPGFYSFRRIGNFPDGKHSFILDYSILHLGSEFKLKGSPDIKLGLELYNNLQDYSNTESIPSNFKNQKMGAVISAKYGQLKQKGDLAIHLYYAYIQKYAIVDYFAQNDWVRWDYSSLNAAGSRISNFQGLEFRLGYALKEKYNLVLRAYVVEELLSSGNFKENGNRIRLDLNIGF